MGGEVVAGARPLEQKAIWSLVAGLIAVFGLFPMIQLPAAIAGLVFGIPGLKSTKRGLAIAGIVLSTGAIVVLVWLGVLLYNAAQHVGVEELLGQFLSD